VPSLLRMPEISTSTTEAVLSRWPLAEGTAFSAKDVVATIETEKAIVDVEAEADGVLLRTLVAEGDEIAVGGAIALLGRPGEDVGDLDAVLASLGVTPAAGPVTSGAPTPAPGAAETAGSVPAAPFPVAPVPAASNGHARTFASPLARRLARDAGLALADVTGSGPGGRVVRRDVEAAVAGRAAQPAAAARTAPAAPQAAAAAWIDTPLSRARKAIAARLTESKTTAPHFYLRGTAHVDRLLALRAELNDGAAARVSVNDLVVKAVARAQLLVPEMNVAWTGDAIRSFSGADVAVAVATDKGLVTPVLRSVETLPISAVATATQDFVARAKTGRLQQSELEGGAITVTNLGMFGTEEFAAILNPPQSAILAVGAARSEPVVVDGRVEAGMVLRVTLSVDHRPVDGATAARWMAAFLGLLEAPVRILA
jgi:pyruvate dehydrogenase E2 component (dihydrolipoamide acetyltransferase)